jgi:hypothetical protein
MSGGTIENYNFEEDYSDDESDSLGIENVEATFHFIEELIFNELKKFDEGAMDTSEDCKILQAFFGAPMDRPDLEDVLYANDKVVKELKCFPNQPIFIVLFQMIMTYNKKKSLTFC